MLSNVPLARIAAALAALALAPAPAFAGGTRTWDVSSQAELDKGETFGAAIEASGRVTVGFLPARGEVPGTTAFTCLATKSGALVGTADAATIQRIVPGKRKRGGAKKADAKAGKGKAKTAKASKGDAEIPELVLEQVAKLEGVVVSAMAELPGGDIAAATLPGGKIVKVDRKGKVSTLATLTGVEQIWALVVHEGKLYAGTGPKGEVWAMSTAGKDPKVVLDVDEKDVLSLLAVGKHIVAGVAPQAKLYQVGDGLEGTMLHDFAGDEVRALALTRTGLVAAVNTFADRKLSSLDALTKNLDRTSLMGQPPAGSLDGDKQVQADGKVYHVELGAKRDLARATEATWESWLEREKQYFTSVLALDENGTVLVSSSDGAKVYRVRGPRDVATVADLEERQATALCPMPKGTVVATTAHGAAVYELGAAPAKQARWVSDVLDATQPAHFGAVRLRGRGPLTMRARTGPTDEPDKRWGEWKTIALTSEPTGSRGSLAALTERRYLQVEVGLGSPDAELRALELFYAPENLAPLLTDVVVDRPELKENEPEPNVTITWKVDARDDDELVYDVRVRPEGGGKDQWIKLNPTDALVTKKELKWDLSTVPDGVYEIEVIASDEPTNGTARARKDEIVSAPFVVDRQRPTIVKPVVDKGRVKATAKDEGGHIKDVMISIDGGPLRAASPVDGLFDSGNEAFEFVLPGDLAKGQHRVVLRARDSFGNTASVAVVVKK